MSGAAEGPAVVRFDATDGLWDLYVTFGSEEDAVRVGGVLVDEGLVACVNTWPIRSVFRWKDEVRSEAEWAALMKTRASRVQAAMLRLEELHPYEVPCVEAIPVGASTAAFADWVRGETGGAAGNGE